MYAEVLGNENSPLETEFSPSNAFAKKYIPTAEIRVVTRSIPIIISKNETKELSPAVVEPVVPPVVENAKELMDEDSNNIKTGPINPMI